MTTTRLIIDRDGSVWSAYDETLVERWGYPEPDFDLPSFAVRNLGAIGVAVENDEILVTFRWLTVKPEALTGLKRLLGELPAVSVRIRFDANGWTDKHLLDAGEAIAWLDSNRGLWLGTGRTFITTPRTLSALSERSLSNIDQPDDLLALMFKKWRLAQGTFSDDTINFLVRFGMLDRTIVTYKRDEGDMAFQHVGANIKLYDSQHPEWTYTAAGQPVADQPDPEYGRWVAEMYSDVVERREPTFDQVDAVVRDGKVISRFRYDRLLLPWQLRSGGALATGLSFGRSSELVSA